MSSQHFFLREETIVHKVFKLKTDYNFIDIFSGTALEYYRVPFN